MASRRSSTCINRLARDDELATVCWGINLLRDGVEWSGKSHVHLAGGGAGSWVAELGTYRVNFGVGAGAQHVRKNGSRSDAEGRLSWKF